ncbi:hypothetical protein KIN20_000540 [Parelaphostrongylus tenuis]|uniref:Uncharacterized protein n=1 Tax=Parelaphostrongylus tenuis TaxID=148309 RepID=A0AAD5MBI8_PARTN|nr:hypothetical protein KIN20_000540 [Parelaphostrongylus tenuis]
MAERLSTAITETKKVESHYFAKRVPYNRTNQHGSSGPQETKHQFISQKPVIDSNVEQSNTYLKNGESCSYALLNNNLSGCSVKTKPESDIEGCELPRQLPSPHPTKSERGSEEDVNFITKPDIMKLTPDGSYMAPYGYFSEVNNPSASPNPRPHMVSPEAYNEDNYRNHLGSTGHTRSSYAAGKFGKRKL